MTDEFKIMADDPEARAILAAYYPSMDGVTNEQRLQWSMGAWQQLHPDATEDECKSNVERLVGEEAEEQLILGAYGAVIMRHAQGSVMHWTS